MLCAREAKVSQIMRAWWDEVQGKVTDTIVPLCTNLNEPLGDRIPFYCCASITGAGGAEFCHLAELLSPSVPFFALQIPTIQRTRETGSSLVAMATNYRRELLHYHQTLYGDAPFYLGGWSAGVMVTYEMAQQLTQSGLPPKMLVAIDKCPRHTRAEIGPWNSTARNTYLWLKRSWRNRTSTWGAMKSVADKLVMIARHHAIYGGPDSEYDSQMVINRLAQDAKSPEEAAFIHAFYHEVVDYVPSPYRGSVLVVMTDYGYRDRVREGWKELSPQHRLIRISGSHYSVIRGQLRHTMGNQSVDLSDVVRLANILKRELVTPNAFSVRPPVHSGSADQIRQSPGLQLGR
jgi:thioesterase domain-containing protein